MKTIDQRTKCTNTHIQREAIQHFTNNFVIRKDYIESDIASLAEVMQYCARNCIDLYSCKSFNDMNRVYAKLVRLHREFANED